LRRRRCGSTGTAAAGSILDGAGEIDPERRRAAGGGQMTNRRRWSREGCCGGWRRRRPRKRRRRREERKVEAASRGAVVARHAVRKSRGERDCAGERNRRRRGRWERGKNIWGRGRRGEGAGRVNVRRWRVKGEPMRLSYFHTF
jgi:hypothetical protein